MPAFERKQIFLDEESVAEQLRRARQLNNIKLEEAAKRLNIQARYLDALEKKRYALLPKGVYGRNFLREYAIFLGLDPAPLIERFLRESGGIPAPDKELFDRQVVSRRHLLALPQLLRNAIIGVLIIACLVYLGFLLKKIFEPPFLRLDYPPDNLATTEERLEIRGQSEPETDITMNGQSVLTDKQGIFKREIYLSEGLNTLTITAKKKYGRPASVSRQVLVKP